MVVKEGRSTPAKTRQDKEHQMTLFDSERDMEKFQLFKRETVNGCGSGLFGF